MLRALFYVSLLVAVLAAAYFLPKLVQSSEKFKPLAEDMAHDMAPTPPPEPAPEPVKPKPTPPAPAPAPAPVVASTSAPAAPSTPAPAPVPTPSSAPVEPPAAPKPVVTAEPAPDLSPFIAALAAGDLAKAGAILDILKPKLEASKYAELSQSLEMTRSREVEKAKAAMTSDKAAAETQAMMVAALKQLQQSQQETSKLIAEMKSQPAPSPAAPAPTPAPVEPAAPAPTEAAASTAAAPLPGTVVLKYGFDSSLLEDEEATKLKPVLAALAADAKAKVEIRGYADKRGRSSYNLGLSAARAQSVKDALRREGIEDARIEVVSFGSFQAKATSSDEAADFRKVEVLLVR